MSHPPYLKQGSVIGICCPASAVAMEKITPAIQVLEEWGFKVKQGKTVGTSHFYFSGTDAERLADLQAMMNDPEVDAILMGRGGYGMSRIIDGLDFSAFLQKPKWICGFSDITVLHSHLQANYNMPCLHSPMCGAFRQETKDAEHIRNFLAALTGGALSYYAPISSYNRKGESSGKLCGGNLSILTHLTGSVSEADMTDKILFIEEIDEYLYHVDRMLLNLKRAGKLEKLKGLIVGYLTDMKDTERPFGQKIEEIIYDKVKEYDYPVCFNFPCGHEDINYTLSLNLQHQLTVDENGGHLELIR